MCIVEPPLCCFLLMIISNKLIISRLTVLPSAVINTMTKGIMKGSQDSSSRQDPKQRPWRSAAYQLPPYSLLSSLSVTTQEHLSQGGTTSGRLGPPISIGIKKMSPQTCLGANVMEAFCSLRFPAVPGLCRIDRKQNRQTNQLNSTVTVICEWGTWGCTQVVPHRRLEL